MATIEEMRSRWVYSELGSPRWRNAYAQLRGDTPLLDKAGLHVAFASLTADEKEQLLRYAPSSSRRGLMGRLNNHPSYRLEHWNKRQVGAAQTIQAYGGILFSEFLMEGCKPGDEATDPREAAKALPYYPGTWEAGIVVGKLGEYLLLDGYTRGMVFEKQAPADARFAVWVPNE